MADAPHWTAHDYRIPQRQPTPGELLFEFVRVSDQAPMSCDLRFHGESLHCRADGPRERMTARLRERGVDVDLTKIDPAMIESLLKDLGEVNIDVNGGEELVKITCE
jgi:hypothetical protein